MSMHELMPFLKSLWTVWFFAMFIAAVAWAMWPSRRQNMEEMGRIPLEDDPTRPASKKA